MTRIDHWLRQATGLDAAALGSGFIERSVRLRMQRLGVQEIEDYERLLRSSAQECNELLESIVITETWFFRDREAFSAFVRLAREAWLPAHPEGVLRVLSAPCASGEEPYSLAMALMNAQFPRERFQIEGIDISSRALERAARAIYGKHSFRGKDLGSQSRYFHETNAGFRLDPTVRERVCFYRRNLLGDDFTTGSATYDFIFCRNLLIYLDRAERRKVFERLGRLLNPNGVLFVGTAEIPLAGEMGFCSLDIAMAFACRKNPEAVRPDPGRSENSAPPSLQARWPLERSRGQHPAADADSAPPEEHSSGRASDDLETARRLADEGKLGEAARMCHAHLRFHGASAEAYYLLGLVHDAHNPDRAGDYYRKALYLEPNHSDALWQLAMLEQNNGDSALACALKRRAQRVQPRSE